jgi:2,3-bisphosphoglycerate-independent phosphoglycerate mutase
VRQKEKNMKYLILVTDGAGDEPIDELGGRTPLEAAKLDNINALAALGTVGMVSTIPKGMAPGSDAANLSVMGYDPQIYHTGRSPLEAVSMGIEMSQTDVAFRCNLVTLKGQGNYEDLIISDHSSGDITTEEAKELLEVINNSLGTEMIKFYPGFSYRHAMIVHEGSTDYELTPPHDVLDRRAGDYLPRGQGSEFIKEMMVKSYHLLSNHPINMARVEKGLNPANSIWIWGQGRKPSLTPIYDKYMVKGVTISAVDLIKGIGLCAGMPAVFVEGATGTIHTNYKGKAAAAIESFKSGKDFVFLHLEGPDECSHQGDLAGKIKSLELIDEEIAAPLVEYLNACGDDYRILILPDHQTPIRIRTHLGEPVPFVLFDSSQVKEDGELRAYGETWGSKGMFFGNGYELTDYFFRK